MKSLSAIRAPGTAFMLAAAGTMVLLLRHQHSGYATALCASVCVAALLGSIVGFAFSAVAASLMSMLHLMSRETVPVLLVCSIVLQLYCTAGLWKTLDWRGSLRYVLGGAVTLPLGVQLLRHLSPAGIGLVIGTLVAPTAAYLLFKPALRLPAPGPVTELAIGAAGGITGGLVAFPGAALSISLNLRGLDKTQSRALQQPYILTMQLMALAWMLAGPQGVAWSAATWTAIPATLLGAQLGLSVFRRLTSAQFNRAVYGLLLVSGLVLLSHAA